ncbi:MAG: enoyl-CoA hydratase/isomerase family protein, partial [Nitriliruptorales bacterium]
MLELVEEAAVVVLRLDDGKMNAFDLEALREVNATLDAVRDSERPLVVTGRAFSAGVDLPRYLAEDAEYGYAYPDELGRCFRKLFTFPRPTVAAVDGHAIAGGTVIACCCDRRLAANGPARIGLTELAVGVPFPASALEIMRHAAPAGHDTLVLDAGLHDVETARRLGVVHEVVDPARLLDAAEEVAARLADIPAATYALT